MVPGLPSGGWNAKQKKTGDRGDGKTASGVNDNVWHRIHRNIFTHREPKSVTEDDVLICSCVPDPVTGEGCGDECINRDVLVECDPNFCPCGSKCQNQKFQSKRYAKLDIRRTGKKGHGLFTKQALRKGEFIVEYVGEVLHEDEYRARKNRYEAEGKRHYYFMTLSSSETIDAAERGNAGRFLNHSCQPNCETQKWMVNGELCIGIYALEPVAADEELTFDYNFERYGDNPIKCYCGTKKCGGWIGGGQKDGEDGDDMTKAAADEDPEDYYEPAPVMLEADESEIAEEETRGREARARARG
jgi:histone-lysine N-methyltransferase SETD2